MSLLSAERIKLTSTRSPWWCSGIAVVLSIGLSVLIAFGYRASEGVGSDIGVSYNAAVTQLGAVQFGSMLIMIMSALAVTTEYRFGVIRTTFQAIPSRTSVIVGKAVLLAGVAAVLGLFVSLVSFYAGQVVAGTNISLTDQGVARQVLGVPVYFTLLAVLAVGVGALLRQSAGAISLLLLWPLVIEGFATLIPKVGRYIGEFGPFNNIAHFLAVSEAGGGPASDFRWGPWASLLYFTVFVFVIFGISLVVVNERDA